MTISEPEIDTVVVGHSVNTSCTSTEKPASAVASPDDATEHSNGCHSCAIHKLNPGNKAVRGKSKSGSSLSSPRAGQTAVAKLRNSCRSCADSKVRCDKGKPTCSRCNIRGIDCQYLQSKRPGRIPGSGSKRMQTINSDRPAKPFNKPIDGDTSPTFSPTVTPSDILVNDTPSTNAHSRADSLFSASDGGFTQEVYLGTDSSSNCDLVGLSDIDNTFNRVQSVEDLSTTGGTGFASIMDCEIDVDAMDYWWLLDDVDGNVSMDVTSPMRQISDTALPETNDSTLLLNVPKPILPATASLSPSMEFLEHTIDLSPSLEDHSGQSEHKDAQFSHLDHDDSTRGRVTPHPCNCLSQALGLLKTLSDTSPCCRQKTSGTHAIDRILVDNRRDIKASLDILSCESCTDDGFMLMVLLMISTKLLARYASTAIFCTDPVSSDGQQATQSRQTIRGTYRDHLHVDKPDHAARLVQMSRTWGGGDALSLRSNDNGDDNGYIPPRNVAQQVLRELHQIQRLVAQLSIKRKDLGTPETSSGCSDQDGIGDRAANSPSMVATVSPLSSQTLSVVEGDVRKCLSSLSATVRNMLRDG